jgi:hypothetical protein
MFTNNTSRTNYDVNSEVIESHSQNACDIDSSIHSASKHQGFNTDTDSFPINNHFISSSPPPHFTSEQIQPSNSQTPEDEELEEEPSPCATNFIENHHRSEHEIVGVEGDNCENS